MHALLSRTFSSVMQRPSAVKLWQIPAADVLPSFPFCPARPTPDEVQATSYFAASARSSSLSVISIVHLFDSPCFILYEQMFVVKASEQALSDLVTKPREKMSA